MDSDFSDSTYFDSDSSYYDSDSSQDSSDSSNYSFSYDDFDEILENTIGIRNITPELLKFQDKANKFGAELDGKHCVRILSN